MASKTLIVHAWISLEISLICSKMIEGCIVAKLVLGKFLNCKEFSG